MVYPHRGEWRSPRPNSYYHHTYLVLAVGNGGKWIAKPLLQEERLGNITTAAGAYEGQLGRGGWHSSCRPATRPISTIRSPFITAVVIVSGNARVPSTNRISHRRLGQQLRRVDQVCCIHRCAQHQRHFSQPGISRPYPVRAARRSLLPPSGTPLARPDPPGISRSRYPADFPIHRAASHMDTPGCASGFLVNSRACELDHPYLAQLPSLHFIECHLNHAHYLPPGRYLKCLLHHMDTVR